MQDVPKPLICAILGLVIGVLVFLAQWDRIVSLENLMVGVFGGFAGAILFLLVCLLIPRR